MILSWNGIRRCIASTLHATGVDLERVEGSFRDESLDDMVPVRRSVLIAAEHATKLARDLAVSVNHMNAGQLYEDTYVKINHSLRGGPTYPFEVRFDSHPHGDGSDRSPDTDSLN